MKRHNSETLAPALPLAEALARWRDAMGLLLRVVSIRQTCGGDRAIAWLREFDAKRAARSLVKLRTDRSFDADDPLVAWAIGRRGATESWTASTVQRVASLLVAVAGVEEIASGWSADRVAMLRARLFGGDRPLLDALDVKPRVVSEWIGQVCAGIDASPTITGGEITSALGELARLVRDLQALSAAERRIEPIPRDGARDASDRTSRCPSSATHPDAAIMSVKEFARHMKVSESTVRRLLANGLPHMKGNGSRGRIRISAAKAEAWMSVESEPARLDVAPLGRRTREARSGGTVFRIEQRG